MRINTIALIITLRSNLSISSLQVLLAFAITIVPPAPIAPKAVLPPVPPFTPEQLKDLAEAQKATELARTNLELQRLQNKKLLGKQARAFAQEENDRKRKR